MAASRNKRLPVQKTATASRVNVGRSVNGGPGLAISGCYWFTHQMTPAGPAQHPDDAPGVRHLWVFIVCIALWVLGAAFTVGAIVANVRRDEPLDFTFWVTAVVMVSLTGGLIRTARVRWSA